MKKVILIPILISAALINAQNVGYKFLGRYTDGRDAACEISAYDAGSKQLFVTNSAADSIDIVDVEDISNPQKVKQIDILICFHFQFSVFQIQLHYQVQILFFTLIHQDLQGETTSRYDHIG